MNLGQVSTKPPREKILCDCCKAEVMAYREGQKIIITSRRHGKNHVAVLLVASCDGTPYALEHK